MRNLRSRFRQFTGRRPTHFRSVFTPSEWERLQLAPLWAFIVVGESDGVVDEKEKAAFLDYLAEASTFPLGLPRDVFVDLNDNLEVLLRRFAPLTPTETPKHALGAVASVVDRKVPHDEAVMYKVAVLDVGSVVAEASGKLLRKNVSKDELNRILMMQRWLRLEPASLASTYEQYNQRERGPGTKDIARLRADALKDGRYVLFSADTEANEALKAILEAHENATSRRGDGVSAQRDAIHDATGGVAGRARKISERAAGLHRGLRARLGKDSRENTAEATEVADSGIGRQMGERVYRDMSIDDRWAEDFELGFTWWAHRQAQRINWTKDQALGEEGSAIVTASTDIATDIADIDAAYEAANALNMSAGLSAIVLGEGHAEARLVSTVSVRSDTLHHTRIFSLATAFQVAEAHQLGTSIAQTLGGRLDISAHPLAGRRIDPDEILSLLHDIPLSNETVPLSAADFIAAAETVRSVGDGQLIAAATAQPHGLTVELPFDHSVPAASLDPTNPVSFLGTSMLTLAVLDDVADAHWRTVQDLHPALSMLSRHTGAHTRYGSGLYVRLGLPIAVEHATPAAVAGHLNQLEAEGASRNHLLGAWYDDDGIWFSAFYPNMLIAPLPADQKVAMLTNIILSQAARSAWAKAPTEELVNAARARGKTRKRKATGKKQVTSAPKRFRPSELDAFARFHNVGSAPRLTYCEIGETFEGDAENAMPAGARIELWVNCEAAGMFCYPHVAVAISPQGEITGIAAAETRPGSHDSCFLGLFANRQHTNLGDIEDWRDRDTFFRAAIPILIPTIG